MASLLMLEVIPGYTRPVVTIKDGTTCLFDTGADTPVWTQGDERLKYTFGAEKVDGKFFLLSGFGKEPELADVYVAHDIVLKGVGKDGAAAEITFKNLVVACTMRPAMVADLWSEHIPLRMSRRITSVLMASAEVVETRQNIKNLVMI